MIELIKKEWIAPKHFSVAAKRLHDDKQAWVNSLASKHLSLDAMVKITGINRFSIAKMVTPAERY